MYRDHTVQDHMALDENSFLGQCTVDDTLSCHVDLCIVKCDNIFNLVCYVKRHIREHGTFYFPFRNGDKSLFVMSTFSFLCERYFKLFDPRQWSSYAGRVVLLLSFPM